MSDLAFAPGFSPDWESVTDYVMGTTWDLWEGRAIASLRSLASDTVICRDAARVTEGVTPIRQDILSTLAAFPDLKLLGEDVIWATAPGAKDPANGVYASHRMTATATHLGDGIFGPATGQRLRYRILSDGWYAENQLQDAWSVRDTGALLRQLGHAPRDWVAAQLDAGGLPVPLTPDTDIDGPYLGRGTMTPPASDLDDILRAAMAADLSVFADRYDRACELARPGGVSEIGHDAAERFWLGLRNAFPSASFRVEHGIGLSEPDHPPRAALRWSLYGKHDGPGVFGPPSGSYVYVIGITHAEFGPRGLRREWTLVDETAVWAQILGAPA